MRNIGQESRKRTQPVSTNLRSSSDGKFNWMGIPTSSKNFLIKSILSFKVRWFIKSKDDHKFRKEIIVTKQVARSNDVYIIIDRLVGKKIIKQTLDRTTSFPCEHHSSQESK